MPKPIKLKTAENKASVSAFINSIEDTERRKDAKTILALMKKITKKQPKMWGTSIIGFGKYEYKRSNGDYGEFMATGFSPRQAAFSLYIMPGYQNYGSLLKKLGKHKHSKACLYIKRLSDIDLKVLEELIKRGYQDLQKSHPSR